MDEGSLDRILRAVGSSHVPPDLDRMSLWADIGWARTWQGTMVELKSGSRERRRLATIVTSAKKLRRLLEEDKAGQSLALKYYSFRDPDPLLILEKVIAAVQKSQRPPQDAGPLISLPGSAFEQAILALQSTYQDHFRRPVAVSRSGQRGLPSGPFLRFAEACLEELGILNKGKPYKRESIISAVKRHPVEKIRTR